MREFFQGWRRKIGCATLAMACVVMGLWIRGHMIEDEFGFGSGFGKCDQWLSLSGNGFKWGILTSEYNYLRWPTGWHSRRVSTVKPHDPLGVYPDPQVIEWRYQWLGFDFGKCHDEDVTDLQTRWWLVPYLAIIIPLTAISSWLLLITPGKSTPMKADERTRNDEGATS